MSTTIIAALTGIALATSIIGSVLATIVLRLFEKANKSIIDLVHQMELRDEKLLREFIYLAKRPEERGIIEDLRRLGRAVSDTRTLVANEPNSALRVVRAKNVLRRKYERLGQLFNSDLDRLQVLIGMNASSEDLYGLLTKIEQEWEGRIYEAYRTMREIELEMDFEIYRSDRES